MSLKGVDVSSYQGLIDWKKVKMNEIDFAILKIIRKDLKPDSQFERNWSECEKVGLPVQGVYNYSYATTEMKARADAKKVLEILGNRKPMVWLDVEDKCQMNLGYGLIAIINAYGKVITDAGLKFGVYTGQSFYNRYIKPCGGIEYPLWIARYGSNNGEMNTKYQPQINGIVGWQYTSKGRINGIKGCVDLNVWYKELNDLNEPQKASHNPYKEPKRLLKRTKPFMQHGDDIKWLQYQLVIQGYLSEKEIDGWFGSKTEEAVKLFQSDMGIAVDGICGVVTKKYLKM